MVGLWYPVLARLLFKIKTTIAVASRYSRFQHRKNNVVANSRGAVLNRFYSNTTAHGRANQPGFKRTSEQVHRCSLPARSRNRLNIAHSFLARRPFAVTSANRQTARRRAPSLFDSRSTREMERADRAGRLLSRRGFCSPRQTARRPTVPSPPLFAPPRQEIYRTALPDFGRADTWRKMRSGNGSDDA